MALVLNFKEMQRRVGRRVSNTSTSTTNDNDLLPKIKDWINERYVRAIDSKDWRQQIANTTLTIVASTREYVLPYGVDKVLTIFDSTNGKVITEDTVENNIRYHAIDLDQTGNVQTGDPNRWYEVGDNTVKNDMPTSEKISVKSSSASDITPLVVHIRGIDSTGQVEVEEDVTLTGTTAADSTYTYLADTIPEISIGTSDGTVPAQVGYITVYGKTTGIGATGTLAIIPNNVTAMKFKWIRVSPLPKAIGTQPTWEVWYKKRYNLLKDDNDIPIIPIADALVAGAYSDALDEDGQINESIAWDNKYIALINETWANSRSPNIIESFMPDGGDNYYLDYGRMSPRSY